MSTRSTIAVQHADGKISQVYCHFDGYPEHTGCILLESYSNLAAIERLVSGGDMSAVDANIESVEYYTNRGEDLYVRQFANLADYLENHQVEEYNYLYANNQWEVSDSGGNVDLLEYMVDSSYR